IVAERVAVIDEQIPVPEHLPALACRGAAIVDDARDLLLPHRGARQTNGEICLRCRGGDDETLIRPRLAAVFADGEPRVDVVDRYTADIALLDGGGAHPDAAGDGVGVQPRCRT